MIYSCACVFIPPLNHFNLNGRHYYVRSFDGKGEGGEDQSTEALVVQLTYGVNTKTFM